MIAARIDQTGTAGAQAPAAVLPFAGGRAEIAARAGVLWIAFSDEGWPEGSAHARPWVSRPCTPDTPAELRALADAVERALPKA